MTTTKTTSSPLGFPAALLATGMLLVLITLPLEETHWVTLSSCQGYVFKEARHSPCPQGV